MTAQALGDRVLRPFLQDTVRWWPLTVTMAGTLFAAPLTIARVLAQARSSELQSKYKLIATVSFARQAWPAFK